MERGVRMQYEGWRNLRTQRNSRLDSLWWRDLKDVWNFENWKDKFDDNFIWEVGNGRGISLWKDKWVEIRLLMTNL